MASLDDDIELAPGIWTINAFADARGNGHAGFEATLTLVPEPSAWLLMALGLGLARAPLLAAILIHMPTELPVRIHHLFEVPAHRDAVARLIHEAFWTEVPGASVETMARRLGLAAQAGCIPLALVALHEGQPVGVVNLVDDDDEGRPEWSPWLAGMVVAAPWRGRGVGSQLVRRLLSEARRLGFERVYFGTDGPGFYTRLGAVEQTVPQDSFLIMRFDLAPG